MTLYARGKQDSVSLSRGENICVFPTPTAGGKMVFARRRRKILGFFWRFLGDFSTFTKDLDTPPVGGARVGGYGK